MPVYLQSASGCTVLTELLVHAEDTHTDRHMPWRDFSDIFFFGGGRRLGHVEPPSTVVSHEVWSTGVCDSSERAVHLALPPQLLLLTSLCTLRPPTPLSAEKTGA